MTQNQPKQKTQRHQKLMLIRYGRMGLLGWFEHKQSRIPKTQSRVVIKTDRGLEMGELVGQFNYRGGYFKSSPEQVLDYYGKAQKDPPLTSGGTFVRFATAEDLMEEEHLDASAAEEMQCCQRFVKDMKLPMKIIDAEHVFGGERIIIYFTSSGRVDFRELVKRLAREYQTRIELRQIGARDEARIVSDYESCGRPCCCKQFLKILEPVNMRMAKLQKATLDPSKISGHCGRLKCCLRYEDATYKELRAKLPKKNTLVRTSKGEGRVVDMQILTQLVVVQDKTGERKAFSIDDIEIIREEKHNARPAAQNKNGKQANKTGRAQNTGAVETSGNGPTRQTPKAKDNNRKKPGRGNDRG
ncbi:MAG: PSP1 domain-containing protein [Planctomycetota bacterium]|jgi:cell fate regulator YaaT (PSP1 superfamily)